MTTIKSGDGRVVEDARDESRTVATMQTASHADDRVTHSLDSMGHTLANIRTSTRFIVSDGSPEEDHILPQHLQSVEHAWGLTKRDRSTRLVEHLGELDRRVRGLMQAIERQNAADSEMAKLKTTVKTLHQQVIQVVLEIVGTQLAESDDKDLRHFFEHASPALDDLPTWLQDLVESALAHDLHLQILPAGLQGFYHVRDLRKQHYYLITDIFQALTRLDSTLNESIVLCKKLKDDLETHRTVLNASRKQVKATSAALERQTQDHASVRLELYQKDVKLATLEESARREAERLQSMTAKYESMIAAYAKADTNNLAAQDKANTLQTRCDHLEKRNDELAHIDLAFWESYLSQEVTEDRTELAKMQGENGRLRGMLAVFGIDTATGTTTSSGDPSSFSLASYLTMRAQTMNLTTQLDASKLTVKELQARLANQDASLAEMRYIDQIVTFKQTVQCREEQIKELEEKLVARDEELASLQAVADNRRRLISRTQGELREQVVKTKQSEKEVADLLAEVKTLEGELKGPKGERREKEKQQKEIQGLRQRVDMAERAVTDKERICKVALAKMNQAHANERAVWTVLFWGLMGVTVWLWFCR
ncbi:hypothetical protein CAC42_554 [Sphaceloma murrayae]|uniref:Uncharacterized protein n=1 Tax=Sphaceloma murrayae TaxID=2082308 RepID=A0A2K1R3T8_9PEZI|nr:hypothetical protein CAC42_554 [Sphaceloma murrayae]